MVTKTTEEISAMQAQIDMGALPKDAIETYFEGEAKNVFGHDAKKDRQGNYKEQGIGAKGNETSNHFLALKKAEAQGHEPPGSYDEAVREIWKRDPDRAEKLRLPKPKAAA